MKARTPRPGSLVANVVMFTRRLRRVGLPVGAADAADGLRALAAVDLLDRQDVYLALRATLAASREHYDAFDEAFREWWDSLERQGFLQPSVEQPAEGSGEDAHEREQALMEESDEETADGDEAERPGYSAAEVLTRRDFSSLSADELDAIARLVASIARRIATRVSRRMEQARHSHLLDMRRTVRHSLRRGGEIMELLRRRRRIQKSQIVLLCDVSGSMDLYSRFLIQFIYALQHAIGRVETFVFSTSLTRVTGALSEADIRAALDGVARTVPNWSGGTKIGRSLRQFLDDYGRRLLDDRTVVIVISDGWDTGDVDALDEAMQDLHRRAGRVIWLNPLLGGPGYEPLCQGMRVALPHVDVFAAAHNLDSLKRLEKHLVLL